jgi:predicted GNAT family acetyltransferase
MARYLDEAEARAAGFAVEHDAERRRFALTREGRVLGTAHYTLLGENGIDFDGTQVTPEFRGTGLAAILAQRAFSDEIVRGRSIRTSCWFMEGYLARHPELRAG